MKINSGTYIDSGKGYETFNPIPLQDIEKQIDLSKIQQLLEEASIAIGELKGLEKLLPNPELLLNKYAIKESLLSSEIEGTQSTLVEVFENQKNDLDKLNVDVREVRNYEDAIKHGINTLNKGKLPLCNRLLKKCHSILMNDVRGGEPSKTKGEFRKSQNWIGGDKPSNAIYVPPSNKKISRMLSDLEKYIHEGKSADLIKISLIHYQFETIHPFLDGNGRIGRLLITLYFIEKGILTYPSLYLSLYFKKNRSRYYNKLTDIREDGKYINWIRFFLKGVIKTSNQVMNTTYKIQELIKEDREKISLKNEIELFDFLLNEPFVDIKIVEHAINVSNKTANTIISKFIELGILEQINPEAKRYKKYIYKKYINIIDQEI